MIASDSEADNPIIIAGGGIGGLTAGLALLKQGRKVAIFERAGTIGDVGAGISLGTTASKGLYSLGLEQALREASDMPSASSALHYQTGEVLGGSFKDRDWDARDLAYTHMIHRANLFEILSDAVAAIDPTALRLGRNLLGFDQDSGGVVARFDDGSRVAGSALIGCDGIRSIVRAQMFGDEQPRYTGRVVYRFLVPMDAARPFMSAGSSNSYVAPGKSLLRYVIRKGSLVNCVAFTRSESWEGEGWAHRVPTEELLSLFEGWHPDVIGLAHQAPLEGTAKWALYDRDPLSTWVTGRAALLGDAAHPMLPFLGLGAATAIEDAVVLGRVFGAVDDVAEALTLYQQLRRDRAGTILLESRRQGEVYGDGPDSARSTRFSHAERMDYDPATVPLFDGPPLAACEAIA